MQPIYGPELSHMHVHSIGKRFWYCNHLDKKKTLFLVLSTSFTSILCPWGTQTTFFCHKTRQKIVSPWGYTNMYKHVWSMEQFQVLVTMPDLLTGSFWSLGVFDWLDQGKKIVALSFLPVSVIYWLDPVQLLIRRRKRTRRIGEFWKSSYKYLLRSTLVGDGIDEGLHCFWENAV